LAFESFPFIVGWELTLACNLRCRHCGSSAGQPRSNELTTDEALNICDQLPPLLVQEVDFTGGEPLMRKDWPLIAGRLNKRGIITKILTNGLLLEPQTIDRIKEVGISGVGISLDGLEKTHDSIRTYSGLFRRVINGIQLLQDAELPITIVTTVNTLNINELPSMLDFLASHHIENWQIQPVFKFGRVKGDTGLKLSIEEYIQLGTFIRDNTSRAKDVGLTISPADSYGYYTDFDGRDPTWGGCPAGRFSCGITSDGRIKGCLSLPDDFTEGDLRARDLWDIWFDPRSFTYTRGFTRQGLGQNCTSCDHGDECQGGCSAMSMSYTDFFHNDPYCFYGIRKGENE